MDTNSKQTGNNKDVPGGEILHFILWSMRRTSTVEACGAASYWVEQEEKKAKGVWKIFNNLQQE